MSPNIALWAVAGLTFGAIVLRPRGVPEVVWASIGAAVLLAAGLVPVRAAASAIAGGADVYFFLAGMIAIAEIARGAGVFVWIAQLLTRASAGSGVRVFCGVYLIGIVVTALLSNDATILLLTPAAIAIAQRLGRSPLPLVYACAFVANAAGFLLPISNPANLLVFAELPAAVTWTQAFALSSAASVVLTGALLFMWFRRDLAPGNPAGPVAFADAGRAVPAGVACVALSCLMLVAAAVFHFPVGRTALACAVVSAVVMASAERRFPLVLRRGSWSIIPLVAALLVIVRGLDSSGAVQSARGLLMQAAALPRLQADLAAGGAVTLLANVLNNLPAAAILRYALQAPGPAPWLAHAALIGIDLGPNLAVSGSLATILWLMILRRANIRVSAWEFTRIGAFVTIPTLALALLLVR